MKKQFIKVQIWNKDSVFISSFYYYFKQNISFSQYRDFGKMFKLRRKIPQKKLKIPQKKIKNSAF